MIADDKMTIFFFSFITLQSGALVYAIKTLARKSNVAKLGGPNELFAHKRSTDEGNLGFVQSDRVLIAEMSVLMIKVLGNMKILSEKSGELTGELIHLTSSVEHNCELISEFILEMRKFNKGGN